MSSDQCAEARNLNLLGHQSIVIREARYLYKIGQAIIGMYTKLPCNIFKIYCPISDGTAFQTTVKLLYLCASVIPPDSKQQLTTSSRLLCQQLPIQSYNIHLHTSKNHHNIWLILRNGLRDDLTWKDHSRLKAHLCEAAMYQPIVVANNTS